MFTDGRYTLQASAQLDHNWELYIRGEKPLWNEYLKNAAAAITEGSSWRVGVDASTISISDAQELLDAGVQLEETSGNLVDRIWADRRPARPALDVVEHPVKYAGESSEGKLERVRAALREKHVEALVVSALDEIAWLLNLRGGACVEICALFVELTLSVFCADDIEYNPVFFSYVLVTPTDLHLFINPQQLQSQTQSYLKGLNATLHSYDTFLSYLQGYAKEVNGNILVPDSASWAISNAVSSSSANAENKRAKVEASPLALMKAIKNQIELQGFRDCHVRDGAALVRLCKRLLRSLFEANLLTKCAELRKTAYFAWLEEQLESGATLTEFEAATKLEEYRSCVLAVQLAGRIAQYVKLTLDLCLAVRSKQDLYKGLSFTTISSTGPNAAIIHYSPSATESAVIDKDEVCCGWSS